MENREYKTKRLDHLRLVTGFCKEIGLATFIDEELPNKSHRNKVSHGTLLVAMILNNLGFVSRTLPMYSEYFRDKLVERLLGEGVEASQLNDDVIGCFLDKLYESGISELYEKMAYLVVRHLKLPCQSLNGDTTSFHVEGAYEEDIDVKRVPLTRGYGHRPDLNQVVLSLITENQAGIPLYRKACNGNAQDPQILKKWVEEHLSSLKAVYQNNYVIWDSALYTEENVQALAAQGQYFITRVPHKLKEAKQLLEKKEVPWETLSHEYEAAWFTSEYGSVSQRWLLVH